RRAMGRAPFVGRPLCRPPPRPPFVGKSNEPARVRFSLSPCLLVSLSPCHPVTPSPCHPVIPALISRPSNGPTRATNVFATVVRAAAAQRHDGRAVLRDALSGGAVPAHGGADALRVAGGGGRGGGGVVGAGGCGAVAEHRA